MVPTAPRSATRRHIDAELADWLNTDPADPADNQDNYNDWLAWYRGRDTTRDREALIAELKERIPPPDAVPYYRTDKVYDWAVATYATDEQVVAELAATAQDHLESAFQHDITAPYTGTRDAETALTTEPGVTVTYPTAE